MKLNQYQIEIREKRFVRLNVGEKLSKENLRAAIKAGGETMHADGINKTDFQKEQAKDTRPDAEKLQKDGEKNSYESSKTALEKLFTLDAVRSEKIAVTQEQITSLDQEIKSVATTDADTALETDEIEKIQNKVEAIAGKPEAKKPENEPQKWEGVTDQDRTDFGIPKPKLAPEFAYAKDVLAGKNPPANYTDNIQTIINNDSEQTAHKALASIGGTLKKYGLEIDESVFLNQICRIGAASASAQKYTPKDMGEVNKYVTDQSDNQRGDKHWYDIKRRWNALMIRIDAPSGVPSKANDLEKSLNSINTQISKQIATIERAFDQPALKSILEKEQGNVGKYLRLLDPGYVDESGKLQPKIFEYLLSGNNLVEDLKKVMILDKWHGANGLEQKIDQLTTVAKLGKTNDAEKQKFLKSLMSKDVSELATLAGNAEKLTTLFGGNNLSNLKPELIKSVLDNLGSVAGVPLIFGGKLNLDALSSQSSINQISEKIGAINQEFEKSQKGFEAAREKIDAKLALLGTHLPTNLTGGVRELITAEDIQRVIANPIVLESIILEKLSKKMELKTTARSFAEIGQESEKQLDETIQRIDKALKTILTIGLPVMIDGKKVPVKIEESALTEEKMANLRKQFLPLLNEFFTAENAKDPKKEYGALLNADGSINLEGLQKTLKSKDFEEFKKCLGDPGKLRTNKTAMDFVDGFGKFVINSDTPAAEAIKAELQDALPDDLKTKLMMSESKKIFSEAYAKAQVEFKKGGIEGIFAGIMALLGPLTKLFEKLSGWVGKTWDKIKAKIPQPIRAKLGMDTPPPATTPKPETEQPAAEKPEDKIKAELKTIYKFADPDDFNALQKLTMKDLMEAKDFEKLKKGKDYEFKTADLETLAKKIQASRKYDDKSDGTKTVWEFLISKEEILIPEKPVESKPAEKKEAKK